MMLSRFGIPHLSYAQLFTFQVLYSNNADSRGYANAGTFGLLGRKKGEWKRALLEVDYTMGTLFLQDKDRIIMIWPMGDHGAECCRERHTSTSSSDACIKEKLLLHQQNKEVMKYGLVQRRAKTAYKKDERFLLIVPGKLLLFKGMDIAGKHVRFVTSLFGAATRLVYGQLEFEVNVPDSKALNLITPTAEELTGWIGAIEKSALFANGGFVEPGGKKLREAGADRRRDPANTSQENAGVVGRRKSAPSPRNMRKDNSGGGPRKEAVYTNRSNDYEGENYQRSGNWQVVERERDQRSQVRDANMENPVELRGLRGDCIQSNDRNMMMNSAYSRMERSSRSNFQPPSLEHSRDTDQEKAFDRERQNNQRLNTACSIQEVRGIASQSAKPAQTSTRDFPDQRMVDEFVDSTDVRRREGRDFDEVESQALFARQGGTVMSRGQGFISQNQAESSGAIADYSPGSTRAWEGDRGAFEDWSTSKGQSGLHRTLVHHPQLSQELPSQASSSSPTELPPKSKQRSVKEFEKLIFYLTLYRKGLVDSTAQTD
ncbi:hypothetical protein GOP47_0026665 [Adiantum capillus-veneris]|nr:hypothetical protein GOP47_0026665 [Adiantum capillus-veneris]